jgi:alcohol dehydrogenase, propanol-preferring
MRLFTNQCSAGGGLGHFAVQYAKVMVSSAVPSWQCIVAEVAQGMRVIAIDIGAAKGDFCKKLGAEFYIDFEKTKDVAAAVKEITGAGAHVSLPFCQQVAGVRPSCCYYGLLKQVLSCC